MTLVRPSKIRQNVEFEYICTINTRKVMDSINLNPEDLDRAAGILKAMAHPIRISILNTLDGGKSLSVTEIHKILGIEQSTASHHLGIMREKGVLTSRREGKNIYYSLRDDKLRDMLHCLTYCRR
jgi:DNA-binding transcriptional ArsR family regulator